MQEIENIPAYLPNCLQLQDVTTRAKDWLNEAEALQVTVISLSFQLPKWSYLKWKFSETIVDVVPAAGGAHPRAG